MATQDQRRKRLYWIFKQTLTGQQTPRDLQTAGRFIEAICDQDQHVACLERLISSANGITALQSSLRIELGPVFLQTSVKALLQYLQEPSLTSVCNGLFLQRIVRCIANPPFLLQALLDTQAKGLLETVTEQCLAWLLLQLVSLPINQAQEYHDTIRSRQVLAGLLRSSSVEARILAEKIKHILETFNTPQGRIENGPGGRHNNDLVDFRRISILPSIDELESKEPPYLRPLVAVDECPQEERLAMHLDTHFRLLREDMLRNFREDLQLALGTKTGRSRCLIIKGLALGNVHCPDRSKWSLALRCTKDLKQLPAAPHDARVKHLKDNRKFLAHDSLGCLVADEGKPVALVTLHRDEDMLAAVPPIICVQLSGQHSSVSRALLDLKAAESIELVILNTALFAYEPILKQLQCIQMMRLKPDLLDWREGHGAEPISQLPTALKLLVDTLETDPGSDLSGLLQSPQAINLDASQAKSLAAGISQQVSLVQGPPGTGKSFIGALIAKALYLHSEEKILVVCYTNHALDQFLEDLLKIGIPADDVVRLGSSSKATQATQPLLLSNQSNGFKFTRLDWDVINTQKVVSDTWAGKLREVYGEYQAPALQRQEIMDYLEFLNDDRPFYTAFQLPEQEDGMVVIGRQGRRLQKFFLLDQWGRGVDAGPLRLHSERNFPKIWSIPNHQRKELLTRWKEDIMEERVTRISEYGDSFNEALLETNALRTEKDRRVLLSKRIVGCTTTAAAKYVQSIQAAKPGVVLVEEAGEILESHILTALSAETKQLILIGDHKQLRPKVHYDLSVEKQGGFDLNRSLFERMVLKGYPHVTLCQQHRMRPEISALVRSLTYPDLRDAPSTLKRQDLEGFQSNLVFITHQSLEEEVAAPDWRDGNSASSKKNPFEAKMILKCVKYLAQQGYGTDKVVVLTPYLAQLKLLAEVLSSENDPVLNDMDSYDLVRAGLMPAATAQTSKRRLRISTVDNYQGEECEVVLVSLTRSNSRGDIGFLSQPERLNVLLSRARDGLIMIGNSAMLQEARKGRDLWQKLFNLLRKGSHIHDGFPVKCERHPDRQALLQSPEDFDKHCPDGGCDEPCKAILKCGHTCPQRCHQLLDHSKMSCGRVMQEKCSVGHNQTWTCSIEKPQLCRKCVRDREALERRIRAELEREEKLEEENQAYAKQLADMEAQILVVKAELARQFTTEKNKAELERRKRELEEAQSVVQNRANAKKNATQPTAASTKKVAPALPGQHKQGQSANDDHATTKSSAEHNWLQQKQQTDAKNDAIDSVMALTGLEDVKQQFLRMKARVETSQAQNADLSKERMGAVLLGNPGTGKTTVARLYAKLLTTLGVLPGLEFVETTGSKLANEGVAGARKHVESILEAGGGVIFLDEAYQLASGHNYGGAAVLDYILAEIENQTGKIVFVLAGYDKQMEKFFEHNQGFESRVPYRLRFADYSDEELTTMLRMQTHRKFNGRMQIENGDSGLYMRIVARRVGRGRGREGFGNARALENTLSQICERQADRLEQERHKGRSADVFMLTKDDMLGPDPGNVIFKSKVWEELQKMIGLDSIKEAVRVFLDRVQTNYERELTEEPIINVSLNRLFLGNPGTGKTSVAKIYGRILADIGLLPSSEVVVKDPSDMIGSALGESEKTTKALLKATEGKVLVIDEAYMLASNPGGGSMTGPDPFRAAVVDTLVSEIQSTPGEPRCVVMLGYREQMETMFQYANPGLSRRFPIDDAFVFEDYDDDQLLEILNLKLNTQVLDATDEAKTTAISVLSKSRRRPNFGNAGEVENLISKAKHAYQQRFSKIPHSLRPQAIIFAPQDFDPDHDRGTRAVSNCRELFNGVIGCEHMVGQIEDMIRSVENMRNRGVDPENHLPFNFIFKGPPGTGKTTTARKMGQIFYDMGFLASTDVEECSATQLIGQYVGQTGPKVQELLLKTVGKVLFIDEAYRLAEGLFAKEAIDELVDSLTKPRFKGKMIVVLAGYDEDINRLLSVNPGLSSRFPEEFIFHNLKSRACYDLLIDLVKKEKIPLDETEIEGVVIDTVDRAFERLITLPSWGNGRDIGTIVNRLVRTFFQRTGGKGSNPGMDLRDIMKELQKLIKERESRMDFSPHNTANGSVAQPMPTQPPPSSTISLATRTKEKLPEPILEAKDAQVWPPSLSEARDPGVSDQAWAELEQAKATELRKRELAVRAVSKASADCDALEAACEEIDQQVKKLDRIDDTGDEDEEERKRLKEELRLKRAEERRAAEEARERARKAREEAEEKRKEEARAQTKLREMGVCCAGYRWIKCEQGYRCAGGAHWVDNAALGM